jgi:hypothetical protein
VANRWSEIIQEPLGRDAAGNLSMTVDNGSIRFVPATDGRPEGLGGIDLRATNGEAARAAAESRGLLRDDGSILIGGVRMNLV